VDQAGHWGLAIVEQNFSLARKPHQQGTAGRIDSGRQLRGNQHCSGQRVLGPDLQLPGLGEMATSTKEAWPWPTMAEGVEPATAGTSTARPIWEGVHPGQHPFGIVSVSGQGQPRSRPLGRNSPIPQPRGRSGSDQGRGPHAAGRRGGSQTTPGEHGGDLAGGLGMGARSHRPDQTAGLWFSPSPTRIRAIAVLRHRPDRFSRKGALLRLHLARFVIRTSGQQTHRLLFRVFDRDRVRECSQGCEGCRLWGRRTHQQKWARNPLRGPRKG